MSYLGLSQVTMNHHFISLLSPHTVESDGWFCGGFLWKTVDAISTCFCWRHWGVHPCPTGILHYSYHLSKQVIRWKCRHDYLLLQNVRLRLWPCVNVSPGQSDRKWVFTISAVPPVWMVCSEQGYLTSKFDVYFITWYKLGFRYTTWINVISSFPPLSSIFLPIKIYLV